MSLSGKGLGTPVLYSSELYISVFLNLDSAHFGTLSPLTYLLQLCIELLVSCLASKYGLPDMWNMPLAIVVYAYKDSYSFPEHQHPDSGTWSLLSQEKVKAGRGSYKYVTTCSIVSLDYHIHFCVPAFSITLLYNWECFLICADCFCK